MKTTHSRTAPFVSIIIAVLMATSFSVSAQGAPRAINYQGQLLDSGGVPITTQVTVVFSLWDNATTGTQLGSGWSDSDSVTPDANGVYSTEIGDDPDNLVPTAVFASASVWLNVNVGGEDLTPRSRLLTVPYALSANTLNGEAYITVATTSDPVTNGLNLILAYNAAKTLMPHGAALSVTNRMTVIVPPGNYDLTTGSLTLDAEFVDLIGLSTARENQYIFGLSNGPNSGVLMQTASDVRIENIWVKCVYTGAIGFSPNSTAPSAYFPNSDLPNTVIRNCLFEGVNAFNITQYFGGLAMRTSITYSGTYIDCLAEAGSAGGAFGGRGGTASGTFKNCDGGRISFGGGGVASGLFVNCRAVSLSFGTDASGGRFYYCVTQDNSSFTETGTPSPKHFFCVTNATQYIGND